MKKCSLCKKSFNLPLFKCWVLKEDWHGNGAIPDYKMITGYKTLALCFECKSKPTVFSPALLAGSPYLKEDAPYPIPLLRPDEERKLNKAWQEDKH